jgi:hypothetical protein
VKRKFSFLLALLLTAVLFASCDPEPISPTPSPTPTPSGEVLVSRIAATKSGKVYLEVDGQPFLYTGAQIRLDGFIDHDKLTIEECADFFEMAAELGVNSVQIPLCWKDIEPQKDVYDFRNVGKILNMALRNGLKVEFLTFFSNVCGMSAYAPRYINEDASTYSRYSQTVSSGTAMFFVQSDPDLLKRLEKVTANLMSAIYDWSSNNNNEHVVIGIQVQNEGDCLARFRLGTEGLGGLIGYGIGKPDGSPITAEELWQDAFASYNAVGKAVKNAKYKVVTRTNLVQAVHAPDFDDWMPQLYALEGIDILGDDIYLQRVADIVYTLDTLSNSAKLPNNLAHIAENGGTYANSPSLALAAAALGGGYMFYNLVAVKEFALNWGHGDEGVYNIDKSYKEHTAATIELVNGLKKAGYELTLADTADIAAFNIVADTPADRVSQTIATTKAEFEFTTETGAIGYAVARDGYVTLYTTSAASISLNGAAVSGGAYGSYKADGTFVKEGDAAVSGGVLNLAGRRVYRFKLDTVGQFSSTTKSFIGSNNPTAPSYPIVPRES